MLTVNDMFNLCRDTGILVDNTTNKGKSYKEVMEGRLRRERLIAITEDIPHEDVGSVLHKSQEDDKA